MNRTSRFVREIPKEYLVESNSIGRKTGIWSIDDHMNLPPRKPGQVAFTSFQRDAINGGIFDKKPPVTSTEGLGYSEGDRVKHIKFGEGTVLEIKNGGRDYEVTVEFDTAGNKKMFASFAKLIKI